MEEEACQEPPLKRQEAAMPRLRGARLGERLTAAPQERPLKARDRGRPREAVIWIVRGIEAGWPKPGVACEAGVRFTRARSDRARAVRRTRINQEYDRMGYRGKACTAFSTMKKPGAPCGTPGAVIHVSASGKNPVCAPAAPSASPASGDGVHGISGVFPAPSTAA